MLSINQFDEQELRALAQLKHSKLISLFEKLSSDCKASLVQADEMVRVHRLQGRAQAFEDLIKAVDDAVKIVERR